MWRSTDGGSSWRRVRDFAEADAVGFGKGHGRRGHPVVCASAKDGPAPRPDAFVGRGELGGPAAPSCPRAVPVLVDQ